jgi:uncharacterized protein (TIGR02265 family)
VWAVEAVRIPSGIPESAFSPPDFRSPLDRDAVLAQIPESATISGMFLMPLVEEAKRRGAELPSARARYVPFSFYPLREHARLLLETCDRFYPDRCLREALRKLGRGAPKALVASTLGKVVLGSVEGPHDVIAAMAKAYPLNARPSSVTVLESARGRSVVRLEDIYYFVDCHHVGAFEGALNFAGVKGSVLYAKRGRAAADLLIQWSDEAPRDARSTTPPR